MYTHNTPEQFSDIFAISGWFSGAGCAARRLRKRVPMTGEFGDDALLGFGAGCVEVRQRAGVALVPSWREHYSLEIMSH